MNTSCLSFSLIQHLRLLLVACVFAVACSKPAPVDPKRYEATDALFELLSQNVTASGHESIADIDHSRLGAKSGAFMPPARVMIFSDGKLESRLMELHPLAGVDLPLRVLAYERSEGDNVVAYNSFEYLASRYDLPDSPDLARAYQAAMQGALQGIPAEKIVSFDDGLMPDQGLVNIESEFDFETTLRRVQSAIDDQDDTLSFGEVDFAARAAIAGIELRNARLILFGAPEPGAQAMANAPVLGLDVFCQKFLIWEDSEGRVTLSFNDVLAVAERHEAGKSIPLRVVNFRLKSVFQKALEE